MIVERTCFLLCPQSFSSHIVNLLCSLSVAQDKIVKADGIETILAAMKFHTGHAGVQKAGCGALCRLASDVVGLV